MKKKIKILIFFFFILAILAAIYFFSYFKFFRPVPIITPIPASPTTPLITSLTSTPALTPAPTPALEELKKLWPGGKRCPKKGFTLPSNPEDIIKDEGVELDVTIVRVNFTEDATCEDAEQIALLLNGQIAGFGTTLNSYAIKIPTRTLPELKAAIQKVKALNDPKIEGVFEAIIPAWKNE